MKITLLAILTLALILPASARNLKLRTAAQVISQSTPKPAAVVCRSVAEVKAALGAEQEAVAKVLLFKKVDYKKKMVLVIRAGRVNAFGVQLSLLNIARAKDVSATVHWQYKPYFGGAAPPNRPGNPTLIDRLAGPIKFQRKNWRYPKGLPLPPSAPPSRPRLPRKKIITAS